MKNPYNCMDDVKGRLIGKNVKTGDHEELPVYLKVPKKRKWTANWVVLWTDEEFEAGGVTMREQIREMKMTATDFRVRDFMIIKCGVGNFVHVNQSQAARFLKIAQPHISKSIKKLVEMNIILEGPKAGKFKTYQVNPAFLFYGSLRDGMEARADVKRQVERGEKVIKFPKVENS